MFKKSLVALALLLPFQLAYAEDPQPTDLVHHYLEKMSTAVHQLNFEGTFIYRVGEHIQGVKVIHGNSEKGEFERMVTLNGPHREIIRQNGTVKCQLKDDTAFLVQQAEYANPFNLNSPEKIKILKANYDVEMGGRDRVAGLSVQRINVIPKDEYRFGYRLWIADEDNHMLLRSEMVDEKGAPLEQVMFTSLKMLDSLHPALNPVIELGDDVAYVQKEQKSIIDKNYQSRWVITQIPPGYLQEMVRGYRMPQKKNKIEHHLFSDGFSSVSVFLEDSDKKPEIGTFINKRKGSVTFVSQFYDDFRVTVVGEVPHVTAKLIAASVERSGVQR